MQRVLHGKRSSLATTIITAVTLLVMLLLSLRAAAAHASSLSGGGASQPAYTALAGGTLQQTVVRTDQRIIGMVQSGPESGFVGSWGVLQSGVLVTITVDSTADVRTFAGQPPLAGTWVEARARRLADGSLLVRQMRPNRIQPGEVIARLSASVQLSDVLDAYRAYRLAPIDSLLSSARIYRFAIGPNLDELMVASILNADRASFEWAEVNFVSEVPLGPIGNPYRTWKWGTDDQSGYINQNAWNQVHLPQVTGVYSGTNVIVAVLDTGIDVSHPLFAGRVLQGVDLVSDDSIPQDGPEVGQAGGPAQGHGTHVSGIVAKLAPESYILPVRVLDANGRGNTFVLAYAIDWAVSNGASIINMSLGSDYDATVLEEAVARAQSKGVMIVSAAGNDNQDFPQFPAAYPGVIGVTAVDDYGLKADFANYGSDWIDLAAPGVAITSSVPVSGNILYASWSGTSMAVPFAAGAAALVRAYYPTAQPADVATLLYASGTDIDAVNPAYAGKLGRLINVAAALPTVAQPTATPEPPTATPQPPTATPEAPTATPQPPTPTPQPPTPTATATSGMGGAVDPTTVPTSMPNNGTPTATPPAPTATPSPAPPTVEPLPTQTIEPSPTQTPVFVPTPTPGPIGTGPDPQIVPNLFLPAVLH